MTSSSTLDASTATSTGTADDDSLEGPEILMIPPCATFEALESALRAQCAPWKLLKKAAPLTPQGLNTEWWKVHGGVTTAGGRVRLIDVNHHCGDRQFAQDIFRAFWDTIEHRWVFIMLHSGDLMRRREVAEVRFALALMYPDALIIDWPETDNAVLDGGDIVFIGRDGYGKLIVVVTLREALPGGPSTRSNMAGALTLGRLVAPLGYELVIVPFHHTLENRALHGTTIMSSCGRNRLDQPCVMTDPHHIWGDGEAVFKHHGIGVLRLPAHDEHAAFLWGVNGILIGKRFVAQNYPEVLDTLAQGGIENVVVIDALEVTAHIDGSPTCCHVDMQIPQ